MTKRVFFVILQSKHGTRQLEDENEQTPGDQLCFGLFSDSICFSPFTVCVVYSTRKHFATLSLSLRRLKTKSEVSRITIRKGS